MSRFSDHDGAGVAVPLLGLAFTDLDADGAAAFLADRPLEAPFAYVVTPNADHVVRLARDPSLWPVYQSAAVRLLDSRVIARIARGFGLRAPRVATGSDVTAALLRRHLLPRERVTIVGLDPVHLQPLIDRLGLVEPAHHNPPMGFDRDPLAFQAAIDFVLAHPARFIFLAVGSPRQENLAAAIAATGRATGTGLCIGAALEFLAGARRRAPVWMQRAGLEWLARLLSDPLRLGRRYLVDCPAIIRLLWRERSRPISSPPTLSAGARPLPSGPRSRLPAFARRLPGPTVGTG